GGVDRSPLARLRVEGAVLDGVLACGAFPAGEVLTVENRLVAVVAVRGEDLVGFLRGDPANEHIPPANLAAVRLQLNRPGPRQRLVALPVVVHRGVIDDELTVQPDAGPLSHLNDPETVPLAERFVSVDQRQLSGSVLLVVEQSARALVGVAVP